MPRDAGPPPARPVATFDHELDHPNGLLFVDRLGPAKRDILVRKLKKAFRAK